MAWALAHEDQAALDRLFSAPPLAAAPLDIYWIRIEGPDGRPKNIVRDYRGQPLAPDHVMTAKHRVQRLNGLLAAHTVT